MQALSNLLKNAGESVGARVAEESSPPHGRVKIRMSADRDASRIEIIDNGVGLPKAERHRLTEPYMTTRVKGTGLGLSTVYGIIRQLDGVIALKSEPGKGATFTIWLPGEEA